MTLPPKLFSRFNLLAEELDTVRKLLLPLVKQRALSLRGEELLHFVCACHLALDECLRYRVLEQLGHLESSVPRLEAELHLEFQQFV